MKRGLWFIALGTYLVLSTSRSTKAVILEYDEACSTSSVSMRVSTYAGEKSDSNSWQYSGTGWKIYQYTGWEKSIYASCYSLAPEAISSVYVISHARSFFTPQVRFRPGGGGYQTVFRVDFLERCDCHVHNTSNSSPIPAGFSSTLDGTGTLYWKILPSDNQQEMGMPVIVWFGFYHIVDYSCGNVIFETGVDNWTVNVGQEMLGPYESIHRDKCSFVETPIQCLKKTCALIGDTITLSYHLKADVRTDDPSDSSGFGYNFEPGGTINFFINILEPRTNAWFKIVDAKMISPNELGIGIMVMFPENLPQDRPRKVKFWATINGKDVEKVYDITAYTLPGRFWPEPGTQNPMFDLNGNLKPTTPFRINLTDEGVPRFTENEKFNLHGMAYCEDGLESPESIKEVEILLPVTVLHGYLYSHTAIGWPLQPLTRNFFYDGFMDFLKDNGYKEASDAWYRTLWGPDEIYYQGDKETDASITSCLDGWVDNALDKTYADKINIVGHCLGGLIARYYAGEPISRNESGLSKVNKVIMIAAPNAGATEFYQLAFDKNSRQEAENILKVPGHEPRPFNILSWLEPTYDALYTYSDGNFIQLAHPLLNTYAPMYSADVIYYSLFSSAEPNTPYQLVVEKRNNNNWYRVIGNKETAAGDGVVLMEQSAKMIPFSYMFELPAVETHASLCIDDSIKQKILDILSDKSLQPFSPGYAKDLKFNTKKSP
jgi:pimeloyl-ACP methyl ester carboxylesterase